MLVRDGATVTLTNCIFENNTAATGAAIDARAATLTMRNCVVNNNTNTSSSSQLINCPNLTMRHVSIVNNVGAAPANTNNAYSTSFAAGNVSDKETGATDGMNNTITLATTGADGAKNFANPTNKQGATLGFDTYLGGYSSFRPLTSSAAAANFIINKGGAKTIDTDIMGNERDLGGAADLGAYEADLPQKGKILYVKTDGNDRSNNGLSWSTPFASLSHALDVAGSSGGTVEEIWVAEGTYTNSSKRTIHEQYYGYRFVEGVNVYGGFSNVGAPNKDDRDPKQYETVLQTMDTDPSTLFGGVSTGRVLVQAENFDTETVYDGFTLQNGYLFSCYRQNIGGDITKVITANIGVTGGAGVYLMRNGVLENCVIKNNYVYVDPGNGNMVQTGDWNTPSPGGFHQAGAGIYNNGGTIRNCNISGNKLVHKLESASNGQTESAWMYGAGLYMNNGTVFNTVISDNESVIDNDKNLTGFHQVMVGTGAFLVNGNFYNNTIVGNKSRTYKCGYQNITVSGVYAYNSIRMYNCIVSVTADDEVNGGAGQNYTPIYGYPVASFSFNNGRYLPVANSVTVRYSTVLVRETGKNLCRQNDSGSTNKYPDTYAGIGFAQDSYELGPTSPALNSGTETIPSSVAGEYVVIPGYDANYTNRIKDCAIDMGAYELDNETNIGYETYVPNGSQWPDSYIYYVTENGSGIRSGASLDNAACADKLQQVLNAAGKFAEENKDFIDLHGIKVVVKVAGYEDASFVYHANTLADNNNPQSYSYVVPAGVVLKGGYNDEARSWNDEDDDNARDIMRFRTVLSAVAVPTQGSTVTQEVNGYHVVTFGGGNGTAALDKPAVIDGLWLTDGSATSMAGTGSADTRGGGAIVPSGAHVRNCVVENCAAIEGGGLYLLPGATVSGTAVLRNTASYGGGIFADNTSAAAGSRAHIISCTVADNEAEVSGGGISMEEGAAMAVNTVVWGNEAQADKNVSGVTHERFADKRLATVFDSVNVGSYYPFNDCFVETQELPSDFENASMVSDSTVYFDTSDHYRTLKEFSPLIKHGVKAAYHDELVRVFGVAAADIQNIARSQEFERADAGAFAYVGGVLPTDLFTRIFVSPTSNVKLAADADINDYLGRSFFTSFTTLDDALSYIKTMRDGGGANDNTHFEILMAAGTYKPTTARTTAATGVIHDQRLYSFVVPHNVSIYGGFSGTELISSDNVTSIELADGSTKDFTADGPINDILAARAFSDFNQNGIKESWEMANQTILSGNINVSAEANNVYHVVYAEAGGVSDPQPIVLDGLTVMNGETSNVLSAVSESNEQGRGGGIYSDGVAVTLNRCRLTNNFGVRGGAVFVRDARLNVIGSIFAGNGWTPEMKAPELPDISGTIQPARGGAVFVSGMTKAANLYAVNTLFVNNETVGQGGAIGTNYAEGVVTTYDPLIDLMNCTFARNKAETNAVIYNHNGKSQLTNTLIWGNKSESYNEETDAAHMTISHSASDYNYGTAFGTGNTDSNVLLSADNSGANGPRFTNPATVAGVSGNDATNLWNPAAISVATDAGAGKLSADGKSVVDGTYNDWFTDEKGMDAYQSQYMNAYQNQYMGTTDYVRYSGPNNENNEPQPKPIDIGVYEYQYISNFSTMLEIYVDTVQAGDGSGNSWENATADLRGAIVGASNPSQTGGTRTVYVRDGDYMLPRTSAGAVFVLNMSETSTVESDSLIVKGSCTGVGDAQNFDRQTVLRNHPQATSQSLLLSVNANSKDVVIEGFSFINETGGGQGVVANAHEQGTLRMKSCAFRMNQGTGMTVNNSDFSSKGNGPVLIYNTLFADGGTGLAGNGMTTVVNATFANNETDFSVSEGSTLAGIYNSVAWNNKNQNLNLNNVGGGDGQIPGSGNSLLDAGADPAENNADIHSGPNFVDPLNTDKELRDYHIRPSLTLLNKGDSTEYATHVGTAPSNDVDLGSGSRLVDGQIDVGAYEYEAPLRPIVYVKAGVVAADADGSSWERPLADLQGAADLVGIYAHNNEGETGYAFVHNNVDGRPLRLSLDNVKVYGGMSDETSETVVEQDATGEWQNVGKKVDELLAARKGLLESAARTELSSVTVDVIEFNGSYNAVADGFIVNGLATVNRGTLSTSVVRDDVKKTSSDETEKGKGLLYNTLVYGGVSGGVKAVNVTATGQITDAAEGSANNRSGATETNAYVTDGDWRYQLMETSADIDHEGNYNKITEDCADAVGHHRDIAGNRRIRNTVDNGCFETWDLKDGGVVEDDDYPHGRSVVYVRENKELLLNRDYAADAPFCPGVLLLEHRAGLRGNDKNVGLSHVIMERSVPADGIDMTCVPFRVTDFEKRNGDGLAVKYYDGSARAAYDYAFDSTDGKAWSEDISADLTTINSHRSGLLLDNTGGTADATVRFIGKEKNAYTEGPGMNADKSVTLSYFNFSEPWTSPTQQSNRFTHKENMSWNLFGSPYLCAMNYNEMAYGRVLYGYEDGGYKTVKTYGDDDTIVGSGYIPSGDAVFTQTATLGESETFGVSLPKGKSDEAYALTRSLALYLASTDAATRSLTADADRLQVNAVEADEAVADFDPMADGVKWMAADEQMPQLYAVRGAGRYSLLSAVSREGTLAVGFRVGQGGSYTIGIPEDCDAAADYEAVVLTDARTGRSTDLLAGAYTFQTAEGGTDDSRFTLSFVSRAATDGAACRIYVQDGNTLVVDGLSGGERIRIYDARGSLLLSQSASGLSFRTPLPATGVYVVRVSGDAGEQTGKVMCE